MNVSTAIGDQVSAAIDKAKCICNWEVFTKNCADSRVTHQFDQLNSWIITNVRNNLSTLNRQTLVKDELENFVTLPKLIGLNRAESILATSKNI